MASKRSGKPIEILLVEDNSADVRLTEEALKEDMALINLSVVGDGVEALKYLSRKAKDVENKNLRTSFVTSSWIERRKPTLILD